MMRNRERACSGMAPKEVRSVCEEFTLDRVPSGRSRTAGRSSALGQESTQARPHRQGPPPYPCGKGGGIGAASGVGAGAVCGYITSASLGYRPAKKYSEYAGKNTIAGTDTSDTTYKTNPSARIPTSTARLMVYRSHCNPLALPIRIATAPSPPSGMAISKTTIVAAIPTTTAVASAITTFSAIYPT